MVLEDKVGTLPNQFMQSKRSFRENFLVELLTTLILSASKQTLFEHCQNIMRNFIFINLTIVTESWNGRAVIYSVLKLRKKMRTKKSSLSRSHLRSKCPDDLIC